MPKTTMPKTTLPKSTYLILLICVFLSPLAWASSNKLQWELYLLGITVISAIGAFWLTKRKENLETRLVKILVAGVYFWVITFLQLIVLALLYSLFK